MTIVDKDGETAVAYRPPEGRTAAAELDAQTRAAVESAVFRALVRAAGGGLLMLNEHRQVLAVNAYIEDLLGYDPAESQDGLRPGEVLRCVHSDQGPDGCGTGDVCPTCGAALSILLSGDLDRPVERECLLRRRTEKGEECLEFRARATPVVIPPHRFTVLTLQDLSDEKRRDTLERIFIHDLLNDLGGLRGWTSILGEVRTGGTEEAAQMIVSLSDKLIRNVESQRLLRMAERGDLKPTIRRHKASTILRRVEEDFPADNPHVGTEGRRLLVETSGAEAIVETDETLLVRILTNMVKNALEAVGDGKFVRLWYEPVDGDPAFHAWNPGTMTREVLRRIFTRSFSTKAKKGRGLGTYAMKLFGERYLGGAVSFVTSEEEGTTFTIRLSG